MPEVWSPEEVEAAVADYLTMLLKERSGIAYSKTAHRRALARLLNGRSDASIERKHQNISAVLIELGMPYIEGYKRLPNYQGLLFEVVGKQVAARADLHAALGAEAAQPATVPTIDNILDALVDPPAEATRGGTYTQVRELPFVTTSINYIALEASNRSLGAAGEQFAVRFEQARLTAARQERLADAVQFLARVRDG